MSDSLRPQRRQPTSLPSPWDSPGKNTGVGCHFLLQCMKVKSESEVAQSCPTCSSSSNNYIGFPGGPMVRIPSFHCQGCEFNSWWRNQDSQAAWCALPSKTLLRQMKIKTPCNGVAEGQTRLSDFTFTFHFHALEKEMATHSSVTAWRIPGMGEPGGLPSMESHRVGHD